MSTSKQVAAVAKFEAEYKARRHAVRDLYVKGMSPDAGLVKYAGMGHITIFRKDTSSGAVKEDTFGPSDAADHPPPTIDAVMRTSYEEVFVPLCDLILEVHTLPVSIEERREFYGPITKCSLGTLQSVTVKYKLASDLELFLIKCNVGASKRGQAKDGTWFAHVSVKDSKLHI